MQTNTTPDNDLDALAAIWMIMFTIGAAAVDVLIVRLTFGLAATLCAGWFAWRLMKSSEIE